MGTTIRPEISAKSRYWLEKHRYYELKHFCLQYPTWKRAYAELDGLANLAVRHKTYIRSSEIGDPTQHAAVARAYYMDRMKLVEQAAISADPELYPYILRGVTNGDSYTSLQAQHGLPCCRDVYYDRYRRFFWLLDKTRN